MKIIRPFFKKIITLKNSFLKASKKKKLAIIMVVLAVFLILASPLRKKGPQYTTEPVTLDTVVDVVSESGNVTSSGRFDVYSSSTGYIEEVYVKNGDAIDRGESLFKVKSTATTQDQATAYTAYQSAVSTQKTAEQSKLSADASMWTSQQKVLSAQEAVIYKNNHNINPDTHLEYTQLEKDTIDAALTQARKDFSATEKKFLEADSAIAAAKASVNSTWLAYQATQNVVITAPVPGVIANFSASLGDRVTVSSSLATAVSGVPTLVILGDISKTVIKIAFNEVDVDKVKIGQTATITFDAFREKKFNGHIATIDTAGTNTNGVITYNATIYLNNPDANIKTEMTVTVSIETAKHENVLTVPNAGIKPYKGGKAVIVAGENKDSMVKNKAGKMLPFHYIPVKTGLKGTTRTEVTAGVSVGDWIVTSSIN